MVGANQKETTAFAGSISRANQVSFRRVVLSYQTRSFGFVITRYKRCICWKQISKWSDQIPPEFVFGLRRAAVSWHKNEDDEKTIQSNNTDGPFNQNAHKRLALRLIVFPHIHPHTRTHTHAHLELREILEPERPWALESASLGKQRVMKEADVIYPEMGSCTWVSRTDHAPS